MSNENSSGPNLDFLSFEFENTTSSSDNGEQETATERHTTPYRTLYSTQRPSTNDLYYPHPRPTSTGSDRLQQIPTSIRQTFPNGTLSIGKPGPPLLSTILARTRTRPHRIDQAKYNRIRLSANLARYKHDHSRAFCRLSGKRGGADSISTGNGLEKSTFDPPNPKRGMMKRRWEIVLLNGLVFQKCKCRHPGNMTHLTRTPR